ncbi:hypothetical protein Tco_0839445 [Tanacetum coccineum]|uniref:Uncharacterized protein n=1 Tax=Tanacetum coccineum TaxID=301880 RepID=A0ABQ5AUR6_9ASTR
MEELSGGWSQVKGVEQCSHVQLIHPQFNLNFLFHSEARSWSNPSEKPTGGCQQLLEQHHILRVSLSKHTLLRVLLHLPTNHHPFYPSLIRSPRTRAAIAQMRAAAPSTYHLLLPLGTPPLLPTPLPAPSTSHRANIPEADTPPRKRLLLIAPKPGCEVGESSAAAAARQP